MKKFNNYIIEANIEDDILNRLYFHTCVEFKITHSLYPYIVESLGKFDNAGIVVQHIIETLKENFSSQIIDCKAYNTYFKYIDIELYENQNNICSFKKYNNGIIYVLICASKEYFNKNIDTYIEKNMKKSVNQKQICIKILIRFYILTLKKAI